jgi:hypothetical protein
MSTKMLAFVVVTVLWAQEPAGAEAPAPDARLVEAQQALDELRLEDAEAQLETLVADPDISEATRAQAWLALGHARASLLETDGARAAFAAALSIDPTLTLPAGTSPKVAALFEKTRAALGATVAPRKEREPVEPATSRASDPDPSSETIEAEPAESGPSRALVATLVGAAFVVGAGGAGAGAFAADQAIANPTKGRTRDEHNTLRLAGIGAVVAAGLLGAGALSSFAIAGSSAIGDAP